MHHICKMVFVFGIFSALIVFSPHTSNAGSNPSVDSCEGLGMLNVYCYNCETGEYLGMISVQAGYNEYHKDCMRSKSEARKRCSDTYGISLSYTGMKWKYTLGLTDLKNWAPRDNCPSAQW